MPTRRCGARCASSQRSGTAWWRCDCCASPAPWPRVGAPSRHAMPPPSRGAASRSSRPGRQRRRLNGWQPWQCERSSGSAKPILLHLPCQSQLRCHTQQHAETRPLPAPSEQVHTHGPGCRQASAPFVDSKLHSNVQHVIGEVRAAELQLGQLCKLGDAPTCCSVGKRACGALCSEARCPGRQSEGVFGHNHASVSRCSLDVELQENCGQGRGRTRSRIVAAKVDPWAVTLSPRRSPERCVSAPTSLPLG